MTRKRVLIACEYSATVRDAFLAKGHDAWSCDILPTDGDPSRHIQGDALEVAYRGGWDLMVGHPPCTYLTYAGAAYWNDPGRAAQREDAFALFMALYNAPIPMVALENPRGYPSQAFRHQDQEINPFDFGNPQRKRICLWLKGLPTLAPTLRVPAPPKATYIRKSGPRAGKPYNAYFHNGRSAKERARFFPEIAEAMADQWGALSRPYDGTPPLLSLMEAA
jgi:hypothetical protein